MGWSFIAPKAADLRSLPVAASVSAALTPVAAQALEMPEAVRWFWMNFVQGKIKSFNDGIVIQSSAYTNNSKSSKITIRPCYGIISYS